MNSSLLRSGHGLIALAICVACYAWLLVLGASMGTRGGSNVDYVIWSGWIATALMVVAMLYCVRKYMHKLRYSPELKLKVPVRSLEAADAGLNELRRRILRGDYKSRGEIEKAARRVLQDEGVHKVVEAAVREGDVAAGEAGFVIETRPPEKWGRMSKWLHAHAYYGLASGVIVVFHGGFALTHPMGILLNLLTALVIVTGIVGLALFAWGPAWMTRHEKDLNFEESFVIDGSLRDKIAALLRELRESLAGEREMLGALEAGVGNYQKAAGMFAGWIDRKRRALVAADRVVASVGGEAGPDRAALADLEVEPGLVAELEAAITANAEDAKKGAAAAKKARDDFAKRCDKVQDCVVLLGQRAAAGRGLKKLNRIKFVMNVWRALHIPASLALMGLIVLHIVSILWY
ncbi:MAG: hypothetical protein H6807_09785 [Planctomycetes bacterium]|nr:hypothetical protein [Planctomycetota bacterium]